MKRNLLNTTFMRSATTLMLATTTSILSTSILAENQNSAILPPSMRLKAEVVEESTQEKKELPQSQTAVVDKSSFEEWKKNTQQENAEYKDFLLWKESVEEQ